MKSGKSTNILPSASDKITKALKRNQAPVETWSVRLEDIYNNPDVRLDASHYDRQTAAVLNELHNSACRLSPLSEFAAVALPGHFVRVWAQDAVHGIPYVNATDLMSLAGMGTLAGNARFLSRESRVDIEVLTIRAGWLLLTCSGTIGRIFYVSEGLDGWVATHDLIRIVPRENIPVGFLYAYLSSPMAQKQIAGYTHGGQIDHVTHHQVGGILVPVIEGSQMDDIHERTITALQEREQAIRDIADTCEYLQQLIGLEGCGV